MNINMENNLLTLNKETSPHYLYDKKNYSKQKQKIYRDRKNFLENNNYNINILPENLKYAVNHEIGCSKERHNQFKRNYYHSTNKVIIIIFILYILFYLYICDL